MAGPHPHVSAPLSLPQGVAAGGVPHTRSALGPRVRKEIVETRVSILYASRNPCVPAYRRVDRVPVAVPPGRATIRTEALMVYRTCTAVCTARTGGGARGSWCWCVVGGDSLGRPERS
eukprot:5908313-Prymnesium_polylepis.2